MGELQRSSGIQSFWYQIFEVAFLGRYFSQSFPVTGLSPSFSPGKGNWCPLIAQKPQTTSPAQSPSPAADHPGKKPAKTGPAVHEPALGLVFLQAGKRWHPGGWCHLLSTVSSLQLHPVGKSRSWEQEESMGVLTHEWDWTGGLFLSLGLHSALRESSVWHFCTGKLAE